MLAGDSFQTLQEAIAKAQVVEEKQLRRLVQQSLAFLKALEPSSKNHSFEITTNQVLEAHSLATLQSKSTLDAAIDDLQAAVKISKDT